MSSPSPVTDGTHVWVMTGTGVLKAFDFAGKEIWARDIQKDYGPFGLNWGYASSPLLHKDHLYVEVLHGMKTDDPSYILSIDKLTGKTRWRVERPTDAVSESPDAYTTPALLRDGGREEIVISGGDYVTGHDPATGAELWRAGGLNPGKDRNYRVVASPIVADGLIYVPSRVRPLIVFRAGGRGDITTSHKVWSTDQGPDVPTPATDGKYIYILNDRGIVWCRDAKTGAEIWGNQRVRPGHLQRVAGHRRRQGLRHQRGRRDDGLRRRARVQGPGRERPRRLHALVAGHLGRTDLPAHDEVPLLHRQARGGVRGLAVAPLERRTAEAIADAERIGEATAFVNWRRWMQLSSSAAWWRWHGGGGPARCGAIPVSTAPGPRRLAVLARAGRRRDGGGRRAASPGAPPRTSGGRRTFPGSAIPARSSGAISSS